MIEDIWSNLIRNAYALAKSNPSTDSRKNIGCAAEISKNFTALGVSDYRFSITTCAESSLISNLISKGGGFIEKIVLVDSEYNLLEPCGKCFSILAQFTSNESEILLNYGVKKLNDFIPKSLSKITS